MSATSSPPEVIIIQILQTTQIFELTTGIPEFAYTSVLFAQNGAMFKAKSCGWGKVDPKNLLDIQHIPPDSSYPKVRPGCSITTSPENFYIKTPNSMSFDRSNNLGELATYEIIKKSPHRNLAEFRVANCLQDQLNPDNLNKSAFILLQDHVHLRTRARRYLPQITEGIRHLHSLNLIHNDINPADIMLREDETPIIIDFETSCAPGKELRMAKRTYGWYDPQVSISQASNDLDAVAELWVWLISTSPDEFQFGQY